MEHIVELLKNRDYHLPKVLLCNYKSLKITEIELVILIYLINLDNMTYNPKQISDDLNIKMNDVLIFVNNLCEKGIISIDMVKINKINNEIINLDLLYEKLAFSIINSGKSTEVKNEGLFEKFEHEIGRGLSPMEFDIINNWLNSDYSEELILCALKEAVYNGSTSNLRYIEKILFEWKKKGIKNSEDVEKNKREFKKTRNENLELFEYDWLNDKDDN